MANELEPPSSFVGQLQRGLGSGYLAALNSSPRAVAKLISRLTVEDPRWDRQLDSREDYYGNLALWCGMSIDSLRRHLHASNDASRDERDIWLAIGVLGFMARRGHSGAVDLLRSYVRSGRWWDYALQELGRTGLPETWASLDQVIRRRFPDDEALKEELRKLYDEPLASWREGDGPLGDIVRRIEEPPHGPGPQPDLTGWSTSELLALNPKDRALPSAVLDALERRTTRADHAELRNALDKDDPWLASLAVAVLARRDDRAILGRSEELLRRGRYRGRHLIRRRIRLALEELPAEATLPLARVWRGSRIHPLRVTADRLLILHATAEDLPWIRRQLRIPVSYLRVYRVCNALEMLTHMGSVGPFDEVLSAYRSIPYSFGRRFAAEALRTTDPEFSGALAYEALWDCEPAVREIAAGSVDVAHSGATERLAELTINEDDEEVRKTAASRVV